MIRFHGRFEDPRCNRHKGGTRKGSHIIDLSHWFGGRKREQRLAIGEEPHLGQGLHHATVDDGIEITGEDDGRVGLAGLTSDDLDRLQPFLVVAAIVKVRCHEANGPAARGQLAGHDQEPSLFALGQTRQVDVPGCHDVEAGKHRVAVLSSLKVDVLFEDCPQTGPTSKFRGLIDTSRPLGVSIDLLQRDQVR